MLSKIIETIEPFALFVIILAGASLAGWVQFSNQYVVGVITVAAGILLVLGYSIKQFKTK